MSLLQKHLRNTFLTGIFAAIPLAVTIFVVVYVERATRQPLKQATGIDIPFVGVAVSILAIYLLGLAVSSLVGRFVLRTVDRLLLHVPLLKGLYRAWKQVTLTPGGKEGMFAKVVLIATDIEHARLLGFTSGESLPGDPLSCFFCAKPVNLLHRRKLFANSFRRLVFRMFCRNLRVLIT